MASHLTAGNQWASLRRPARSAKLSVADRVGHTAGAEYRALWAVEEEGRHRWQTGTALAVVTAAMSRLREELTAMCGDSS